MPLPALDCFRIVQVHEEEQRRDKMAAFCMGLNNRLGAESLVFSCMDGDLVKLVWEQL